MFGNWKTLKSANLGACNFSEGFTYVSFKFVFSSLFVFLGDFVLSSEKKLSSEKIYPVRKVNP